MDSFKGQHNQVNFQKPLIQGVCAAISIFLSKFEKPLPFGVAAFFPRFISVQHLASSRAPMNGSLVSSKRLQNQAELDGRVFLM